MASALVYRAVIFDLFGTLVEDVQLSVHERMAGLLGLTVERFLEHWSPGYEARGSGKRTFEECLIEMCSALNLSLDHSLVREIAMVRVDELAKHLQLVKPGALSLLDTLTKEGTPRALISNASVEVHFGWSDSPIAAWFPNPIFSCDVGLMKPDPAIYRIACEQLRCAPEDCVFIGDGGDQELIGAAALGMTAVQVGSSRPRVPEAKHWVSSLDELAPLLGLARI